jgi:hypothetical protein
LWRSIAPSASLIADQLLTDMLLHARAREHGTVWMPDGLHHA